MLYTTIRENEVETKDGIYFDIVAEVRNENNGDVDGIHTDVEEFRAYRIVGDEEIEVDEKTSKELEKNVEENIYDNFADKWQNYQWTKD